jgi:DNA anti-recombination protein RmuC
MTLGSLLTTLAPFVPLGTTYMGGRQAQSAARTSATQAQQAADQAYRQQMAILAEQRRQAEAQMAQLQAQFEAEQANMAAQMEQQRLTNEATLGMSRERLGMEQAAMAEATAERERKRASAAPFREATLAYLAKPVEPFRPSIGLYKR